MKKQTNGQKTHWFRNTLCVLIACGIVGTILSAILFLADPGKTYATASVQFSFDGAAEGNAPNGYAFDISAVSSDEVLNAAVQSAGMADRYTAEEIRAQIRTAGVYPSDIVSQIMTYESLLDFNANRTLTISDYHPTLYNVTLFSDFDRKISRKDLESLLQAIMENFKSYFGEVYTAGKNPIEISYNLDEYDYPQQLTVLTQTMNNVISYADEMYRKEPTLTLNGQGFNDISVRLNNLIDTDISRLSAEITMNALTKNTARLITQYDYEIHRLTNRLNKKVDQLARLDALLASYEKNEIIYVSTSDSLSKIDGNSSETYDELVASRREVADSITTINNDIAYYQLLLSDLTGEETAEEPAPAAMPSQVTADVDSDSNAEEGEASTETVATRTQEEIDALAATAKETSAEQTAALEADIETLTEKLKAVMTDFAALIQLYNDKWANNLTVSVENYQYYAPSLISGAFIKQTVKVAGVFCVVGFIVCMILLINSRRKEEKE